MPAINFQESIVKPESSFSLKHFLFYGGAEEGKFILFGCENNSNIYSDDLSNNIFAIKNGDIILEIENQNVCGYMKKDVQQFLQGINKDSGNLILKYVERDSQFPQDLHTFLCQKFVKGSQEHILQQKIRENLYMRTVPCTTRKPRDGEIDGVDYIFLSFEQFCALQSSGQLIEYGVYEGNLYGTPRPKDSGSQGLIKSLSQIVDINNASHNNSFVELGKSLNSDYFNPSRAVPKNNGASVLEISISTPNRPTTVRNYDSNPEALDHSSPASDHASITNLSFNTTRHDNPTSLALVVEPVVDTPFSSSPSLLINHHHHENIVIDSSSGTESNLETLDSLKSLNSISLTSKSPSPPNFSSLGYDEECHEVINEEPPPTTYISSVICDSHDSTIESTICPAGTSNAAATVDKISEDLGSNLSESIYQPLTIGHQPNSLVRPQTLNNNNINNKNRNLTATTNSSTTMPCVTVARNFEYDLLTPPPLPQPIKSQLTSFNFKPTCDQDYRNFPYATLKYGSKAKADNTDDSFIEYRFTKDPLALTSNSSSPLNNGPGKVGYVPGKLLGFHLVKSQNGFGFTILGNSDPDKDFLFVNKILPGGPASQDGNLVKGDILVYVDNECVLGFSHSDILTSLRSIAIGETIQIIVCRGSSYNAAFALTRSKLLTSHNSEGCSFKNQSSDSECNGWKSAPPINSNNTFESSCSDSTQKSGSIKPPTLKPNKLNKSNHLFSNKTLPHKFKLKVELNGAIPATNSIEAINGKKRTIDRESASKQQTSKIYEDIFGFRKLRIFGNVLSPQNNESRRDRGLEEPYSGQIFQSTRKSKTVKRNYNSATTGGQLEVDLVPNLRNCTNSQTSSKSKYSSDNEYERYPRHNLKANNNCQNYRDTELSGGKQLCNPIKYPIPTTNTTTTSQSNKLHLGTSDTNSLTAKLIERQITRSSLKEGFGFIILSSMDGKSGSYINKIIQNSPASNCRPPLVIGQKILAINGIDVRNKHDDSSVQIQTTQNGTTASHYQTSNIPEGHFTHQQIVELIKRSGLTLNLLLQDVPPTTLTPKNVPQANGSVLNINSIHQNAPNPLDTSFNTFASRIKKQSTFKDLKHVDNFLDRNMGSPIGDSDSRGREGTIKLKHPHPSTKPLLKPDKTVKLIELYKGTRGFGFSIRGGSEFRDMPLYVYGIAEDGPAHKDGRLKVGDELLEINGTPTEGITHSQALTLIKSWEHLVRLLVARSGSNCKDTQVRKEDEAIILNPSKLVGGDLPYGGNCCRNNNKYPNIPNGTPLRHTNNTSYNNEQPNMENYPLNNNQTNQFKPLVGSYSISYLNGY